MVLTKKLDALEEFRIQREQLMAKFEDQETKVEQQKEMYETQIYEQVQSLQSTYVLSTYIVNAV